jgi:hypothetical protein
MKRLLIGLAALGVATAAYAAYAPIPLLTTAATNEPSQINSTLNGLIQSLNANVNPASFAQLSTPRNMIDNGQMQISQRGTGTVTCAQAAGITSAAYVADRWGCSGNVTSGAGNASVITATPSPPAGFTQSVEVNRITGALTQPICLIQEVPTGLAVSADGQTVTVSAYLAALAGLVADNGGVVNISVITGTTADQGLGTMTASPAITPAWAGLATVATQAFTTTTTFGRVSMNAQIGSTVKEIGVEICFTPTASGYGATDGFAVTGVQLELGNTASAFEFHNIAQDLAIAQRYFYRVTETTGATIRGSCTNLTSSISNCVVPFPVPMRVVPTMTYTTGFAIALAAQTSLTACTANATSATASSVASNLSVLMSCATSAAGGALGTSTTWGDATSVGSGIINASADF